MFNNEGSAALEIDVENQRGEKVLTGTAAVRTSDA